VAEVLIETSLEIGFVAPVGLVVVGLAVVGYRVVELAVETSLGVVRPGVGLVVGTILGFGLGVGLEEQGQIETNCWQFLVVEQVVLVVVAEVVRLVVVAEVVRLVVEFASLEIEQQVD